MNTEKLQRSRGGDEVKKVMELLDGHVKQEIQEMQKAKFKRKEKARRSFFTSSSY